MTEESHITDEMRAALDTESAPWMVEVERGAIRQFARSTGSTNPIYYDLEAAKAAGHPDLPAPPGFLGRYVFLPGESDATFSNPKASEGFPVGEFQNILNGGQSARTYRRVYAGETLTGTSKFTNLTERQGRLGPMIIVDGVQTFRDNDGKVVAEFRETTIHYKA
jgi:acyl dehydratase